MIFAQERGIILRIRILTEQNIKHFSCIPSEEEVLLSLNCKLFVMASIHKEDDGFYYVDLAEHQQGATFIF